jgi:TolB-like protein/tRNA A-37 threonylcarbamoyl transferase component Bud32
MIGSQILHYTILEQLGEGGMGEVYLAEDTRLHRRVALKFVHKRIREDPEARERLIREARAASGLNHPNIVSIHAIEETPEHVFIVMEYVEGDSIRDLVKRGALPLQRALEAAGQVLRALSVAHGAGIVHRDVKSDNVFIDRAGHVRVLDFGLARSHDLAAISRTGSSAGTPAYMSPEQVQGGSVDHRSDLFSFGVVLYEMVAGRLPFRGEHESAVTYSIVNETPAPVAKHKPDAPAALQGVIDRLLAKDPHDRYASADEVSDTIERIRAGKAPAAAGRPSRRRRTNAWAILAWAAVAIAAMWLVRDRAGPEAPPGPGVVATEARRMLVVLPFENLGPADQEYFADGITEEITTRLARMSELGVISRTSAMKYKGAGKSLREIGDELDIDYALEGSIRWDKSGEQSRVRVNAQLLRVSDDTHLWADTYDRVFDQIFALQTDIAENVAKALDVTLLEPERQALASRPTENLDAYHYYLKGREAFDRAMTHEERDRAVEMLERATALDSAFSQAQALLARLYANDYFNEEQQESLDQALAAAEAALRHGPGQPQGHVAMGYYHYYGSRDYERALEEFALADMQEPNNADLLEARGLVQRRQGRWEESARSLERAVELDPDSRDRRTNLINTYLYMHRWEDVDVHVERGLALHPAAFELNIFRAVTAVLGYGDVHAGRAIMADVAQRHSLPGIASFQAFLDMLARDFTGAIEGARRNRAGFEPWDYHQQVATAYLFLGDERATVHADSARAIVREKLDETPDDIDLLQVMAFTEAVLGNAAEATRLAERVMELMPLSRDAIAGSDVLQTRMFVRIVNGQYDGSLDDMETLLSIPSMLTPAMLRLFPAFDGMRDMPRFQRLVAEKTNL